MKKIVEVLLDRMISDAKTCDLNLIRDNLKRVESDSFVETIITNTIRNVWLSADGIYEIINDYVRNNTYKLLSVYNIATCTNTDKVAKEYCFDVSISSCGDLYINIKCDIDVLIYTRESAFDDYVKGSYLRTRSSKPEYGSDSVLFKHKETVDTRFYVGNIHKHILRSE